MVKLFVLVLVMVGVICATLFFTGQEAVIDIKIEPIEDYTPKEITYAPIECFINETHYDTKCYEDFINGN